VKQLRFVLRLDRENTEKMPAYYLYRSGESNGGRPIIDGVYIQRNAIGPTPPEIMNVLLEADSNID
jgi:hypothetical protein